MTFEEAKELALAFRRARDWEQFHNPKDLAISISIEAAELLEVFQWSGADLEASAKTEHAREELADIAIYSSTWPRRLVSISLKLWRKRLATTSASTPLPRQRVQALSTRNCNYEE